jgi:hypothetical protein
MADMTHRERVLAALNHRQPDRVPVDLGATRSTSIVVQAYERLNRHLGSTETPRIFSKWLNIAHPSQAMLARFDIDTRSVSQAAPITGKTSSTKTAPTRTNGAWCGAARRDASTTT